MKTRLLLVVCLSLGALAETPCCDDDLVMVRGGFCGDPSTRIKMNCTTGYIPLREVYIEQGKLYTRDAPDFAFAVNSDEYCLGKMYRDPKDKSQGVVAAAVICFQDPVTSAGAAVDFEISGYLTLISSAFLALTIMVYMYLPQLRDLQGLCYLSMCISLAFAYLSLGILQLGPSFEASVCEATGFTLYFWMMANFFWMNVICINMYRSVNNATYLKQNEGKQYFNYSLYGWGSAFTMLTATLVCNYIDGDHWSPGIGNHSCWFTGRMETWIFFYGPMAVLLGSNVVMFVLSSMKLWSQDVKYEVSKLNNIKYKFLLSLKLFLVMGISWIFEVASFAHGESHIIWKIMDIFNCLQGVVIFVLLVVLRKRAMVGLAKEGVCLFLIKPIADRLSPHDDPDDQPILDDDAHTEVMLN